MSKNSESEETAPTQGPLAASRHAEPLPTAKDATVPSKGKLRGKLPVDQDRVRAFIRALLAGKTAPEAAELAGYAPQAIGRLLRRRDVQDAIRNENRARDRVVAHTPAKVEAQIGNLAFSDVGDLLNPDLSLKPLDEMPPDVRAAITGITTQEFCDQDGKVIRRVHKIQLERKQPALETLGEINGLIYRDRAGTGGINYAIEGFQIHIHLEDRPEQEAIEVPAVPVETTQQLPPPGEPRH